MGWFEVRWFDNLVRFLNVDMRINHGRHVHGNSNKHVETLQALKIDNIGIYWICCMVLGLVH